jgi:hypothetical protein
MPVRSNNPWRGRVLYASCFGNQAMYMYQEHGLIIARQYLQAPAPQGPDDRGKFIQRAQSRKSWCEGSSMHELRLVLDALIGVKEEAEKGARRQACCKSAKERVVG